jgi:hypothetical protein
MACLVALLDRFGEGCPFAWPRARPRTSVPVQFDGTHQLHGASITSQMVLRAKVSCSVGSGNCGDVPNATIILDHTEGHIEPVVWASAELSRSQSGPQRKRSALERATRQRPAARRPDPPGRVVSIAQPLDLLEGSRMTVRACIMSLRDGVPQPVPACPPIGRE